MKEEEAITSFQPSGNPLIIFRTPFHNLLMGTRGSAVG
jgi:hypothetical protein